MLSEFISITDLQRHLKSVFASEKPMRFVLSKNKITGLVFSKETVKMLMESGMLDQLREELWELNDPETRDIVLHSRKFKKGDGVPFDSFMKNYAV